MSRYKPRRGRDKKKTYVALSDDTLEWSNYLATISLLVILILIYAVSGLLDPENLFIKAPDEIKFLFGQINILVWNGEWYRLITAMFIHADIFHLGGNLLFLAIFGLRMEDMENGSLLVFVIFLISGLAGNILTLIFFGPSLFLSLGASGGVQGLLAGNVVLLRRQYARGPLSALFIMSFFFMITIGPSTNFIAHLGGLIGGAGAAYFLEKQLVRQ